MGASFKLGVTVCAGALVTLVTSAAAAGNVLVLGDGDADAQVSSILTAASHVVTISPVIEHQYNGTNPAPGPFCTVVHLNGETYMTGMTVAGQTALESYVSAGGGFVGMEWNAYEEGASQTVNMPNLTLAVRTSGSSGTLTYTTTSAGQSHPVMSGLPASFTFNAAGNIGNCKNGTTVLALAGSSDGVCVNTVGIGRVVYFNHGGNWNTDTPFNDTNVANLLVNAVNWSCGVPTTCGNGIVEGLEQCDDANANNNDDCLDNCLDATCGDGFLHNQQTGTEQCDDANANNNDDCLDTCEDATCGDGFVHDQGSGMEQCDDSNTSDNDDCLNSCALPMCGDGFIHNQGTGTEQCDDGNLDDTDACVGTCMDATCGDGFVQAGVEQCDEGTDNSDTAANTCRTSCIAPSCGDGVVDMGESCDDGMGNSDTLTGACRTNCALASCGDGVIDSGEACDDGSANSDTEADACRATCTSPRCGDRVVDTGEACDDPDNDACSIDCTGITPGFGGDSDDDLVVDSGCGCTVIGERKPIGWRLALLGLIGAALAARRRRGGC